MPRQFVGSARLRPVRFSRVHSQSYEFSTSSPLRMPRLQLLNIDRIPFSSRCLNEVTFLLYFFYPCCITCLNIWLLKCSLVVSELFSGDVINRRCPECTAVSFSQFLWTSKFFEHSHIRPLVLFVSARKNIDILLATEAGVQPTWNMVKMN